MFLPPPPSPDPAPRSVPTQPAGPSTDEIYFAAVNLLDQGLGARKVKQKLRAQGYPTKEVGPLVDALRGSPGQRGATADLAHLQYGQQAAQADSGHRNMLIGGLVCVVGIVVTLGTLAAASESEGGRYVIAWGAIVFGAIQFCRGFAQFSADEG